MAIDRATRVAKWAFAVESLVSLYDRLESALPPKIRKAVLAAIATAWTVLSAALTYVLAVISDLNWLVLLALAVPVGLLNLLLLVLIADRSNERKESLYVLLRGPASEAAQQAVMLGMQVRDAIRGKGVMHNHAAQLLDILMNDLGGEHSAVRNSVESGASRSQLQARLLALYRAYQALIDQVRQIGQDAGYDWSSGNYSVWKRTDEDFLRRVDDLTLRTSFTELRDQVTVDRWPFGGRRDYWV